MSSSVLSPPPPTTCEPAHSSHLRAALNGTPAALLTFDDDLTIRFISERLPAALGVPRRSAIDAATVVDLLEGSEVLDAEGVTRIHQLCLSVGAGVPEQRTTLAMPPGSPVRFLAVGIVRLGDGCAMASFEDVTALRDAETRAIEQAMCDPLTGLPNRQLFKTRVSARLDDALPDAIAQAVLLVDIDRFKMINDTLGHPVGDGLLRLVSKRLRSVMRHHDLVARLGGDEFAAFVSPASDLPGLFELTGRLVDMLGRPYLVDGHLLTVSASVGLALSPADGRQFDHLVRNADLALYEAKRLGRNQFVAFRPEMDVRATARRSLELDLRRAIAMREFELFYQPQIDLETELVVGFEALLRWRHPVRGLVAPGDFIPLAEEIGMIVPLGEWVMREACHEATRWPAHVSISVNVSPLQFEDADRLVETVAESLAASGLPGHRLEVEITESVLLRNEVSVLAALHRLRAMDVRIAMDDFGTGYSSLSQLNSFPFDKIKIDRSFVRDQGDLASQNAVIRAITALGVSLGMSTIAEGVETAEQLDRIRSGGCQSVQGYLFSKPVPAGEVGHLLARFGN